MRTALVLLAVPAAAPVEMTAPVFKLTGLVERGDHVYLTFEVTNPNSAPMPYVGYTADSFDPKIPEGRIAPIFRVETLRGKEWKAQDPGWCGTGIGPVAIPAKEKATFEAHVPLGDWQEVRVGLSWHPTADQKGRRTAWSSAIDRKDVKKPE